MRRSRLLRFALLAALLLGALRIGYAQTLGLAQPAEMQPIDARFAGLRSALRQIPWDEPIAFTTRAPHTPLEPPEQEQTSAQRALARASYALAPRVLLPDGQAARFVILDLEGQLPAPGLGRTGLEELWRSDDGRLILARTAAP